MAFLTEQEQYVGAISFAPNFSPSASGVLIHFNCDDIEATLASINNKGGKTITPKTKIETKNVQYFAIFSDSEGNHIGLRSEK